MTTTIDSPQALTRPEGIGARKDYHALNAQLNLFGPDGSNPVQQGPRGRVRILPPARHPEHQGVRLGMGAAGMADRQQLLRGSVPARLRPRFRYLAARTRGDGRAPLCHLPRCL